MSDADSGGGLPSAVVRAQQAIDAATEILAAASRKRDPGRHLVEACRRLREAEERLSDARRRLAKAEFDVGAARRELAGEPLVSLRPRAPDEAPRRRPRRS